MRIGIDSHAAEREGSGNSTYIRNLITNLGAIDQENEYVLFATNEKCPFYSSLKKYKNFRVIRVQGSPAWYRIFIEMRRGTHRENLDILHVQYFAPFSHTGALVNTIHDLTSFKYPAHFSLYERGVFRTLLPGASRRATAILTGSDVSKQDLIEILHVPDKKIKVIYYGINEIFRREEGSAQVQSFRKNYELEQPYLLYVGRIDPRKNLARLIEAFLRAKAESSIPHTLVIAGDVYRAVPGIPNMLSRSPYHQDVRFLGYVQERDLPFLYSCASALIYPSEYEGFGLPPLEAMACGTPVIASDITVFREILGDAALLVDPKKTESITAGILRLLADEDLQKELIQKASLRLRRYSWRLAAAETLKAYRQADECYRAEKAQSSIRY